MLITQDFIIAMLLEIESVNGRYWIGLNERDTIGKWVWEAGDDPGFTWANGLPDPPDTFT